MESDSGDGMEASEDAMQRWVEAGAVLKARSPELFRAALRSQETTLAAISRGCRPTTKIIS
jgi:hypothetical protein